ETGTAGMGGGLSASVGFADDWRWETWVDTLFNSSALALGLGTRNPWLGRNRLTTVSTTINRAVIARPTRSPFSMKNRFQSKSLNAIAGLPIAGWLRERQAPGRHAWPGAWQLCA